MSQTENHSDSIELPVVDPGPDALEREIASKASKGPRVTIEDIEENIRGAYYFTAEDGVVGNVYEDMAPEDEVPLSLLTFCVLVLRNGFTVTGKSACASPENFDAGIGRNMARENAINKIWPLMGYELRSKLAGGAA